MLNDTTILMNTFLQAIDCQKISYFQEQDFTTMTLFPRYFRGSWVSCHKQQYIKYENHLLQFDISCIADKRIDEICSICFYSEEFNHENCMLILKCINQLLINFSLFISEDLYQILLEKSIMKSLYLTMRQKLQRKHQHLRTNKPLDIYDILKIDSSKLNIFPYNTYLIIAIYEEKTISVSLVFDLYHQL